MPANDQELRRAISRRAASTRWGHPEAAEEAARDAAVIQLEHQIRRSVINLTTEQRMRLAVILAGGDDK